MKKRENFDLEKENYYESQLQQIKNDLSLTQKENEKLTKEVKDLKNKVKEEKESKEISEKKLNAFSAEYNKLREDNLKYNEKINEKTFQNQSLEKLNKQLLQENNDLKGKLELYKNTIQKSRLQAPNKIEDPFNLGLNSKADTSLRVGQGNDPQNLKQANNRNMISENEVNLSQRKQCDTFQGKMSSNIVLDYDSQNIQDQPQK